MLVDDDEDDRDFFLQALSGVLPGATCETASNGKIALDKLLASPVRPDLLFLDLNMPLMNGRQLLLHVKNHEDLRTIPVVILSTSGDAHTVRETLALGAIEFITKPDVLQAWELSLRTLFDKIDTN